MNKLAVIALTWLANSCVFGDAATQNHSTSSLTTFVEKSTVDEFLSFTEQHADFRQLIQNLKSTKLLSNVSSECQNGFDTLLSGFQHQEAWAYAVLDSFGKPGAGITRGNLKWPGRLKMCLNARKTLKVSSTSEFAGKYCSLNVPMDNNTDTPPELQQSLQVGICAPEACSQQELTTVIQGLLPTLSKQRNTTVVCKPDGKKFNTDTRAIVAVTFLLVFFVIISIATIYDMWLKKKIRTSNESNLTTSRVALSFNTAETGSTTSVHDEKSPVIPKINVQTKVLLSFSAYSNAKKILDFSSGSESLTCINGIRFLSLTWIILGHTYSAFVRMSDNPIDALEDLTRFSVQTVLQGSYAVDSFFAMSGLLVTYLYFKECEKTDGNISWLKFYIHRYLRLTVVYAAILFFIIPTYFYWASGPFWEDTEKPCIQIWWQNLLYLNNFFSDECMGHTWYLANDWQFYIICPTILIPLKRRVPIGLIIIGFLILVSWITTGVLASTYNITALLVDVNRLQDMNTTMRVIYIKPYCRIGPYLIGMICGWLLFKTKCKITLKKSWILLGWTAAAGCNLSVVYGLYNVQLSTGVAALYNALARSAWSLGLCWVIFACCSGYGGSINTILSWRAWNPLSRLTYCAYLWHLYLVNTVFYGQEELVHYSRTLVIIYFAGLTIASYAGALVISLMFEAPFLSLEKVLLRK